MRICNFNASPNPAKLPKRSQQPQPFVPIRSIARGSSLVLRSRLAPATPLRIRAPPPPLPPPPPASLPSQNPITPRATSYVQQPNPHTRTRRERRFFPPERSNRFRPCCLWIFVSPIFSRSSNVVPRPLIVASLRSLDLPLAVGRAVPSSSSGYRINRKSTFRREQHRERRARAIRACDSLYVYAVETPKIRAVTRIRRGERRDNGISVTFVRLRDANYIFRAARNQRRQRRRERERTRDAKLAAALARIAKLLNVYAPNIRRIIVTRRSRAPIIIITTLILLSRRAPAIILRDGVYKRW